MILRTPPTQTLLLATMCCDALNRRSGEDHTQALAAEEGESLQQRLMGQGSVRG